MQTIVLRVAAAAILFSATFQAVASAPAAPAPSKGGQQSGPGIPIPTCPTATGCGGHGSW